MTGDEGLDDEIMGLMDWYSRPANCDVAGRHPLRRLIRLAESHRTLDGDMAFIKMSDGRLQGIEGDRIRDPDLTNSRTLRDDESPWYHGVKVGSRGQMQAIAIHRRKRRGGYEFEREVRAGNVLHFGYFDALDQRRGVSPLASAIHSFQDAMEVKDYALAKAKVTQLFALAITREMGDDDYEDAVTEYSVDFGKGPIKMDLDPGDKAEFLESRHPSTEFQSFMTMTLQAALKALDIPWSFYDEAYTNFFGSKSATINYLQSCKSKRDDVKDLLNRITAWRLNLFVANGDLVLPAGVSLSDLKWEWIHAGQPWIDPSAEIDGYIKAIDTGLRTRTEIRRELYGDDWKPVIKKLSDEKKFMVDNDVYNGEEKQPDQPVEQVQKETVKDAVDAYGVGVRAGVITPHADDENHFRQLMGLPPVNTSISQQWNKEPTRRPITLTQPASETNNQQTQAQQEPTLNE